MFFLYSLLLIPTELREETSHGWSEWERKEAAERALAELGLVKRSRMGPNVPLSSK